MKEILTACGYNSTWSFRTITAETIAEIEEHVEKNLRTTVDAFAEYTGIKPFKFLPGHSALILGIKAELLDLQEARQAKRNLPLGFQLGLPAQNASKKFKHGTETQSVAQLSAQSIKQQGKQLKQLLIRQLSSFSTKIGLHVNWTNCIVSSIVSPPVSRQCSSEETTKEIPLASPFESVVESANENLDENSIENVPENVRKNDTVDETPVCPAACTPIESIIMCPKCKYTTCIKYKNTWMLSNFYRHLRSHDSASVNANDSVPQSDSWSDQLLNPLTDSIASSASSSAVETTQKTTCTKEVGKKARKEAQSKSKPRSKHERQIMNNEMSKHSTRHSSTNKPCTSKIAAKQTAQAMCQINTHSSAYFNLSKFQSNLLSNASPSSSLTISPDFSVQRAAQASALSSTSSSISASSNEFINIGASIGVGLINDNSEDNRLPLSQIQKRICNADSSADYEIVTIDSISAGVPIDVQDTRQDVILDSDKYQSGNSFPGHLLGHLVYEYVSLDASQHNNEYEVSDEVDYASPRASDYEPHLE